MPKPSDRAGGRRKGTRNAARVLLGWAALLLGGLACPPAAASQEIQEDVQHWCQDFWMSTRQEILECLQRDYAEADAELNRVYRQTMATLTPAERTRLRSSQRIWLVRYDSVLTSFYSKPWANRSRVKVLPSQIKAVRDRTAYLRTLRVKG